MAHLVHPSLDARIEFPDHAFAAMLPKTLPSLTWACPAGEVHARADDLRMAALCADIRVRSYRTMTQMHRLRRALDLLGAQEVCVLASEETLAVARARRSRYDNRKAT